MVNKLLLPQEIETFYVIPTLRRYLALNLLQQGMSQKTIALILGVQSAAISQYRSTKRGHKVEFDTGILDEIKASASRITNHFTYLQETQRLLAVIRQTNTLCHIHKQFSSVPNDCIPERIGCDRVAKGGCVW